jgi:hypothetical protein
MFSYNFSVSSLCVLTGSGAHPAFYTIGSGGPFPWAKARPGRDADHSLLLVPRSRMSRSYTSSLPRRLYGGSGTYLLYFFVLLYILNSQTCSHYDNNLRDPTCHGDKSRYEINKLRAVTEYYITRPTCFLLSFPVSLWFLQNLGRLFLRFVNLAFDQLVGRLGRCSTRRKASAYTGQ